MTEPDPAIDDVHTAGNMRSEAPSARQRAKLQPLLALRPYLLSNTPVLILAAVALVVAASATLAIPVAVRRMIDFGTSGEHCGICYEDDPRRENLEHEIVSQWLVDSLAPAIQVISGI